MLRLVIRSTQQVAFASSRRSSTSSVMDIFSNLRWKAAEVLTSGFSAEEKAQLMGKLDVVVVDEKKVSDGYEEETQKTIGEAVVAARMAEAQRQEHKWDAEREFLLKNAEEAARARVESDLLVQERRIAMVRWQKDLAEENAREEERGVSKTDAVDAAAVLHPTLGRVVADLGYKKVYQVSAHTLASIPVWKKQRLYRHDRAKVIAADKMKTLHLGLPGIVVLHEDMDGKLSILDGQHRIGALALLSEKAPENFDLENILVEVFSSDTADSDAAEEIFVEINKSEPIKMVDMPGVAKAKDRKIITQAAAKLHEQYPTMFRPSQQCRVPHLNVDNLRDALFASEVIKRHDLKTTAALVNWMQAQNELLGAKFQQANVATKSNKKALDKAQEFDFYLGMESSWLYN